MGPSFCLLWGLSSVLLSRFWWYSVVWLFCSGVRPRFCCCAYGWGLGFLLFCFWAGPIVVALLMLGPRFCCFPYGRDLDFVVLFVSGNSALAFFLTGRTSALF